MNLCMFSLTVWRILNSRCFQAFYFYMIYLKKVKINVFFCKKRKNLRNFGGRFMDHKKIFGIVDTLNEFCDGERIHKIMKQISGYHRIQASEGYRQAVTKASQILRQRNVKNEIKSYPADLKTFCFTQKMFREWNCSGAWLDITAPWKERAADYSVEEMSLIQRSAAGDFSWEDIPVIYIPDQISPEEYIEEIGGKIIFVENGYERWVRKMMEENVAAIITVSMPEIKPVRVGMSEDPRLKEAHANLSFHHYTKESEEKLRGFAVTPRFGKRLKEACLKLAKEGSYPTARFKIDATVKDGFIENVEVNLPGETDEEVLMTAHLCHPRSSVNDNASGAACGIEAMALLKELIKEGKLPRPKRTIKMLLIPEFTGTYAYLSENEDRLPQIVGGFNMDMVAGRQDKDAGPLIIVDTPDCAHSFSGDLGEVILKGLSRECAFGGNKVFVPLFSSLRVPFVFGSDHYILSDPTVDIPTAALTQWPDKTYHTSADDAAHVDPDMLRRAAVIGAAYTYIYASMDAEYASELLPMTARRFYERIDALRRSKDELKSQKAVYLETVIEETLKRYEALLSEEELERAKELFAEERIQYQKLLAVFGKPAGTESMETAEGSEKKESTAAESSEKNESPEGKKIPKRLFKGPAQMRCILADMTAEQKEKYSALCKKYPRIPGQLDYIFYETDGKRSMEEIAMTVQCQTDTDCLACLPEFFRLFEELGLITLKF